MPDEVDVDPLFEEEVDTSDVTAGDLGALIEEHERGGIGSVWLREIRVAASRVARRYSPSIYARSAAWDDEAIKDLVQDVVERMLTKGQAQYICDVANDFGHARALIYRQVRMTLIDRRQRTSIDNLFDRATQRFGEPPFEQVKASPRSWRIAGSALEAAPQTHRLIAALAALPRLPGNGTERATPIWTTDTLTDALILICNSIHEVEELGLRAILEESLTVFATTELVSDKASVRDKSGELDPSELIMANELTEQLEASLTAEEAMVLAGKWIGDSDGDIARRLGVSRPTAAKCKASAYAKVQTELESQSAAIVSYVLGRLQSLVIVRVAAGAE